MDQRERVKAIRQLESTALPQPDAVRLLAQLVDDERQRQGITTPQETADPRNEVTSLPQLVHNEIERQRQAEELQTAQRLTIEQMRILDPRIGFLIDRTKRHVQDLDECEIEYDPEHVWYGVAPYFGIKPLVCMLTGFDRQEGPANLQTHVAYDTLYEHMVEIVDNGRGEL